MAASRTLDVKLYSRGEIDRNDLQVVQQVTIPINRCPVGLVWLTLLPLCLHYTTYRCREGRQHLSRALLGLQPLRE
jgi:hypothetical protein